MILNEILTKQNILNALSLREGDNELSKELKVKIVRLRIAYNKVKKQFEDDVQEFTKDLVPEELRMLQGKPEEERTDEEKVRLTELINKVNSEYTEFITQKGLEEVKFDVDDSFTSADLDELIAVNIDTNVEINGNKVNGEELLMAFDDYFCN